MRGAAFIAVAFPSLDARVGSLEAESALPAAARGGVSLYLEALAVARTVSGLIRLAAPSSLAQTIQREANEIVLGDAAFGCRGTQPLRLVLSDPNRLRGQGHLWHRVPFLMVVGVDRALVGPAIDLDSTRPGARATLVVGRCRAAQFSTELISASR